MATDPVCGMYVDESTTNLSLARGTRTYYFCSTNCWRQFSQPEHELTILRRRLAVAWPLSVAIVAVTYLPAFTGAPWIAFALASVVQFYAGLPFYRGFWDALRARAWNMDVLIAVGTTAAYAFSAATLLDSSLAPTYYFDASALIITLILTGNYLEYYVRERARGTLRRLGELLPSSAVVVRNGAELTVPVNEVRVGDLVRVLPGARFPADGTVREGRSSVDEAVLTGESLPVPKGPGDGVIAGAVNGEGPLVVEAIRVGSDTFLAGIGELLTEAESSRVPVQRLADRIAERFVPTVLALAVLAALAWFVLGGVGGPIAVLVFVSVVITACPCAFGIATPAAILVGTDRAAEDGVLFKGGTALEAASEVSVVLTDKTGTLTLGTPTLTDLVPAEGAGARELLSLAAGLERGSEHPFAKAVLRSAESARVAPARIEGLTAEPGHGIRGTRSGQPVAILAGTSPGVGLVDQPGLRASAEALARQGKAWSAVIDGSRVLGILGFSDPLADGVPEAVRALRNDGVEVVMVTGDHAAAAESVASRTGIREVHANVSPEGKLQLIRERQARGARVAYVGDGINDAPALAQADLGIAIGAGTDVAREAGGVVLVRSDFRDVALALRIGRRTVRKIRGNLAWALGYNAILLPVAMGALVPWLGLGVFRVLPVAGATAMAFSSSLVVLNSFSLRWVSVDRPRYEGRTARRDRPRTSESLGSGR